MVLIESDYRFAVQLLDAAGAVCAECHLPLGPEEFEAAVYWTWFQAMRRQTSPPMSAPTVSRILPRWCASRGEPWLDGFSVVIDGAVDWVSPFPSEALSHAVGVQRRALLAAGQLQAGEQVNFRLLAYPDTSPAEQSSAAAELFDLAAAPEELAVIDARLSALVSTGEDGGQGCYPGAYSVIIHRQVTEDAIRLAQTTPEVESGGLLLGYLARDTDNGDLFVAVTAFIAVRACGTETSLHFSPADFADAQAILALRKTQEQILGWSHFHPLFCRHCPPQQRRDCPFQSPFFSDADRDVHRTLFPQAWSQALLLSDLGGRRPQIDLFGWHQSGIQNRGFVITEEAICPDQIHGTS